MKLKLSILTVIGILILFLGILASINIGAKNIPPNEIYNAIFFYDGSLNAQLILNVRIPRVLCAALTGGMLALSGAMIQGIMRNPIADPSIMGITQGAALAISLSSIFPIFGGIYSNFFMALIGASISGILIFLFAINTSNQNISKVLLASTAISTLFLSLAYMIALLKNKSQELAFWIAGTFNQSGWIQVLFLILIGGIFCITSFFMCKNLNLLNLGDESATGLGISPSKIKLKTIIFLIPICAVCVATAGNISFVGLFVPHIIRKIIGNNYKNIVPLSFLYGSILLTFADILSRTILAPYELPIGLFTTLIGVPIFLLLVRKENN